MAEPPSSGAAQVLLIAGDGPAASGRADLVVRALQATPGTGVRRAGATDQVHAWLTDCRSDVVVVDLEVAGATVGALVDPLRRAARSTGLVLLPERPGEDVDRLAAELGADDVVLREELSSRHLARAVSAAVRRARASREHQVLQDRFDALTAASVESLADAGTAARFQAALLTGMNQAVVVTDPDATVVFWNPAAERLFGWSAEEAVGRPVMEVTPRVEPESQASDIAMAVRGAAWGGDEVLRRRDGSVFQALVSVAPVYDEGEELVALIGVSSDISARKQAEQRSRTLSAIVDSMADAVLTHGLDGVVLTWNPGAERLFGWSAEEAVGTHLRDLFAAEQAPGDLETGIAVVAASQVIHDLEVVGCRRDGSRVDVALTASPVLGEHGTVVAASVIARDVSERRRLQQELHHQATHDALTGLPNRALLEDRLEHTLAAASRTKAPVAALFVDIDGFKTVNDAHGHLVGDALLQELARRLTSVTRPADTVARFGGDEFVIVCDDTDEAAAQRIAQRVAETCRPEVQVGALHLQVTASIGIAVSPPLEADGGQLVRCADAALYRAKADGRDRWHVHGSTTTA